MLLAGLIAGALYNPWTGPQTRDWLMDKVAGDDDLQPLDGFDLPGDGEFEDAVSSSTNGAAEAAADVAEAARRRVAQVRHSRIWDVYYGHDPPAGLFGARPERVVSSDARDEPARARDVVGLEQDCSPPGERPLCSPRPARRAAGTPGRRRTRRPVRGATH